MSDRLMWSAVPVDGHPPVMIMIPREALSGEPCVNCMSTDGPMVPAFQVHETEADAAAGRQGFQLFQHEACAVAAEVTP